MNIPPGLAVRGEPVLGGRTYSPDDLTETGLRVALFGDPMPVGELSQHMARMSSVLEPLAEVRPSEEVVRPVAHLLLTLLLEV